MENFDNSKSTNGNKSIRSSLSSDCEIDIANENIDQKVLQETGEHTISADWSVRSSALNVSNTSSSSCINIETLTKCASPSDTLNDKEDFIVLECTNVNISKFNADETKCPSTFKTTKFQKKHRPFSSNVSQAFENILNNESQMEIDITMKSPKLRFSKKNQYQPCNDISDYNLSSDSLSFNNVSNVSQVKQKFTFKKPELSFLNNDNSNIMEISKTEDLSQKFTRKTINLVDSTISAFDNIINDLSTASDVTSNNNKTSLSSTSVANNNGISICDSMEVPNLNYTYNIPLNGNSTQIGLVTDSIENNTQLNNISAVQPIDETYTIKNNLNETFTLAPSGLNSSNKTVTTLSDMSNIINQSKLPVRKSNINRKLQLSGVSQNYNFTTVKDNHSSLTVDNEMNETENKSKRFKSNNSFEDTNSKIGDNIRITSSQENDRKNISSLTNTNNSNNIIPNETSMEISNDDNLSKSNKSLVESNELLDEIVQNSTVNDETSSTLDTTSKRFKQDKPFNNADSNIFENIIASQEIEMSAYKISTITNGSLRADLNNVSKSEQNVFKCTEKSSEQQTNVTQNVENSTASVEIDDIRSNRFKLDKQFNDVNSKIFDNIITNSQENEVSISKNADMSNGTLSNALNTQSRTSSNNKLLHISNSQQNMTESVDKSLSQQPNILLEEVTGNSMINNETNEKENAKSNKFVSKNMVLDADSKIFDNIIVSSQESENMSISKNYSLLNTFNSQKNIIESIDKLSSQRSNVLLDAATENSTINDETNEIENVKSNRFGLKKKVLDVDSKIFENILISSQESEMSTSKITNVSNETIPIDDLAENSSTIKLLDSQNSLHSMTRLSNKTSSQESNVLLSTVGENDNFNKQPDKFNISKLFDHDSQNNQEDCVKNSSIGSHSQMPEPENNFTNYLGSQQFNISVPSIPSQKAEENSHKSTQINSELTQNITINPSQSPGTHFTGKKYFNAHSGVFSDLIDNSLNSNISLNVSKQMKFQNHKNTSVAHSIIFENVITNSQESNITLTLNKTASYSRLLDQSLNQNDEISVFANTLELSSACKSLRNLNRSLNKIDAVKKLNLEKSNISESETTFNNISNDCSFIQSEKTMNYDCSLSHISALSLSTLENNISNKTFGCNQSNVTDDANSNNVSTHSLKTDISTDNEELTLFNSTIASMESSVSQKNQSKRSSTPNYSTSVPSNNDDSIEFNDSVESIKSSTPSRNQSKRSNTSNASSNSLTVKEDISIVSMISTCSSKQENNLTNITNEKLNNKGLSDVTVGLQEQNELSLNQLQSSTSKQDFQNASRYSFPTSLLNVDDEKLENKILINTTIGVLEQNELSLKNSRNSSYTSNKSLMGKSTNNVSRMSTRSVKSKNKSFDNVEQNTSIIELSEFKDFSNVTAGSRKQKESSSNKLKRSISTLFSPTQPGDNSNNISTCSSKQKKQYHGNVNQRFSNAVDEQQENERLSNISAGPPEHIELLSNKSESSNLKHHLQNNSRNSSNLSNKSLILKEDICSVNAIHSLNQKNLSDNKDLSIIAARSLELKESLINQSSSMHNKQNDSREIAITSCNLVIPEDNMSRISTRSLKQKSYSFQKKEPAIEVHKQNKSFCTRVTRSSSVSGNIQKLVSDKTLTNNKSLVSESNVNRLSTRSTRSSKRIADSNVENVEDSMFWTTLSENSTSKTTLVNDMNELFETPKTSKSTTTEHNISNTIENISAHEQKKTTVSNKTLTNNKSLVSESNVNRLSTRSTRSSKRVADSNVENVDDSMFWTTLSENSTSKTTLVNDMNELFETPKTNKSTTTEHNISNTIENISAHEQKKTTVSNKTLTSNKSLVSESNVNRLSTRSTRSSKRVADSNVENSMFWTTLSENSTSKTTLVNDMNELFETPKTNKSTTTELNISNTIGNISAHEQKKTTVSNKTLTSNKSLVSENNVNRLSTRSTRSSKHLVITNTENSDVKITDSVLKTTSKDLANKSTARNDVNELYKTPKNNKLTIAENIMRTIGIMSVKKQKVIHPGAFELEDPVTRRSNRPLMKRLSSENSPSILTRVLAGNKTFETITPLSQSLSETVTDQSQTPENFVKEFKTLYNKEPWITKRLYNFLVFKLQPKYNIYSVKYAEKFVKYLALILKEVLNNKVDLQLYTDMLRYHMARYEIAVTTFDYLQFLTDFIPDPYYKKLVPRWNLETSNVKFDPLKYIVPIMEDEEFLTRVLENLKAAK